MTERFADRYIAIKGCGTVYKDAERKGAPVSSAIARLAAYEEAMPLERAQELAKAEKDGRLVVLPCKPDAVAWAHSITGDLSEFRFEGIYISEGKEISYQTYWGETFSLGDFGETVFLTREEAEAALKKREEADNEAD